MRNQLSRAKKARDILIWAIIGACLAAMMDSRSPDRTCAVVSGLMFVAALVYTRYVLQIRFLEVPSLWLLVLGVFHLGLVVPWALGLYDAGNDWWIRHEDIPSALLLINLAMVSYQIGIIASVNKSPPERGTAGEKPEEGYLANRILFMAGLFLTVAGAVMYIYGFSETFGRDFSSVAYTDMYQTVVEVDSRWYGVGLMLFPIGVYTAIAGAARRQVLGLFLCIALWAGWQLFLGFRGKALLVLIVAAYMAVRKGFSLPRRGLVAGLIVILYLIPLISFTREEAVESRFTTERWSEANPFTGLAEMGQAIWPVAETYRLIGPSQLRLGRTYLAALYRVAPNIGAGYAPGKRFREIALEDSPAYWFVLVTSPYLFRLNLGRGFSVVAEAYMNFGIWGVVIIFFGLGYALVRFEARSTRDPFWLAVVAIVLDPLLWLVRNDFTVFTRSVVWGCGYVFLAWLLGSGVLGSPKLRIGLRREKALAGKSLPGSKRALDPVRQ